MSSLGLTMGVLDLQLKKQRAPSAFRCKSMDCREGWTVLCMLKWVKRVSLQHQLDHQIIINSRFGVHMDPTAWTGLCFMHTKSLKFGLRGPDCTSGRNDVVCSSAPLIKLRLDSYAHVRVINYASDPVLGDRGSTMIPLAGSRRTYCKMENCTWVSSSFGLWQSWTSGCIL